MEKKNDSLAYTSSLKVLGMPLISINIGANASVSKGIIAIGNVAVGAVAIGGVSVGLLSLGGIAAGLVAFGAKTFELRRFIRDRLNVLDEEGDGLWFVPETSLHYASHEDDEIPC